MSKRTKCKNNLTTVSEQPKADYSFSCVGDNGTGTEVYDFEMSAEVRDRIEKAANKHCYIHAESISDLQTLEKPGTWCRFIKRTIDIVVSFCAILVFLIPALVVMLAVFIDDPGKVFFRQYRVGRNGKRFKLYKFRTMKKEAPKYMSTMEFDDPDQYITRLGRFLRKYSLDEIPQLLNVLKGDMSLVGPRPLISDEYEIHQMRTMLGIYSIRPGVTGLAQINGRDTVDPATKVRWDHKYLETIGFVTDIKILFSTIPKVFGHEGMVEGYSIYTEDNSCSQSRENAESREMKEKEEKKDTCV